MSKVWFITGTSRGIGRAFAESALERGDKQVSSIGGVAAFPSLGAYQASKWALEGFSDSLSQEVAGLGIAVTIVEPGGFSTDWAGSSAAHAELNPAYDKVREAMAAQFGDARYSDPANAGAALLQIVDAQNPPLRVFFDTQGMEIIEPVYARRLKTWADWAHVSRTAQS